MTPRLRTFPFIVLVLALPAMLVYLSGCAEKEEAVTVELVRPVKTILVAQPEQGGLRNFPARIDALKKAELSFRIPGKVSELPIREGDPVERGQVLAKLDPTDFQIVLTDRQATYDQAKNDYERAKELVKDGFISRTDFDKKEADFKNAVAALDQARQDMLYTELDAPFSGTVAKRYVERFEEVQAKEPMLALHDSSTLEVKIDVPETLILKIDPGRGGEDARVPVTAAFDSIPGRRFDVAFKEVATRADAKTQTFEVTFTMPAPPPYHPGVDASAEGCVLCQHGHHHHGRTGFCDNPDAGHRAGPLCHLFQGALFNRGVTINASRSGVWKQRENDTTMRATNCERRLNARVLLKTLPPSPS
jgi:RND family efflux transporter MFP subunit